MLSLYIWFWEGIDLFLNLPSDDLSFKKVATQLHTATGSNYEATNAVDGKSETCTKTDDIGGNSPRTFVWWKVDLGRSYNLYSIDVLFKNYSGYGM